ncbi:hypothetical protein ACLB2K_026811 [Fragaria x ananassa]
MLMALAITKTVEQELSLLTLMIILTALRFASNNTAEYEALIAGLQLARDMGATDINRISDSQLSISCYDSTTRGSERTIDSNIGNSYYLISRPFSEIFTTEVQREPSWMDPIVNFLKNVCLPAASRIRHRGTEGAKDKEPDEAEREKDKDREKVLDIKRGSEKSSTSGRGSEQSELETVSS